MTKTSPSSRRSQAGSARPLLVLLLAIVMFAAGSVSTWWWLTRYPPTPTAAGSPTPPPDFGPLTPSTLAAGPEGQPSPAAASPEPEPSPVTADAATSNRPGGPPPARRVPKPPVLPPPAQQLAQLLSQADSAVTAKRFAEASELYDRALKIDPKSEPARAGKARIAALSTPARSFVLGTTVVESLRAVGRDLEGFETGGVGVKRAPKVEGLIELVMEPSRVNPGDPYAVKVFLKNDGKKPIDVDEMKVSMIVDGKWTTRSLPAKVKRVAPQQRALLEELPGVWRAEVKDWAVEAVVTSKGQDVYRNRLTWK